MSNVFGKFGFMLLISVLFFGLMAGCRRNEEKESSHAPEIKHWAYQLQKADPQQIAATGFELVVMDYSRDGSEEGRYSSEEIGEIKKSGIIPIAYVSIGEAEDYRFYWQDDWNTNPPSFLGPENPEWKGNYAVKYWDSQWQKIIFQYLDKVIEEGFSGVYLDKIDEFELWSDPENGEKVMDEETAADYMIQFILKIADYCREKASGFYIIPQNGERILEYDDGRLLKVVSGWAAEDLFYDGTTLIQGGQAEEVAEERLPYLDLVVKSGKFVLSVDYVDDGTGYSGENLVRIKDYINRAKSRGYIPYAAREDRELDSLVVIPGIQP